MSAYHHLRNGVVQGAIIGGSIVFNHNFHRNLQEHKGELHLLKPGEKDFALYVILVVVCIVCAACASGLTQGFLNLDLKEMKVKAESGTYKEKMYAKRVLPIITKHHYLLVTLMLWNACATEALPVFLDALVPTW